MVVAGSVAIITVSAAASPTVDLSQLDLRLDPADIAPAPPPLLPQGPLPPRMHGQSVPEIVGDVDQVRQAATPNRRAAGTGPLGSLTADEGVLKELLENKTIPLFRVRMAPPF